MRDKYHNVVIKVLIFIIDFWLIDIAFTFTLALGISAGSSAPKDVTAFFLIFSLIWIIAGFLFKVYRIDTVSLMRNISINLLATFVVHTLMIFAILTRFNVFNINSKFLVCLYIIAAILIISSRVLFKLVLKHFEFSEFDQRKVIIIGATGSGRALHQFFQQHEASGYKFKGFFYDDEPKNGYFNKLMAGDLSSIKAFCVREQIDEIYFTLPVTHKDLLEDILKFADDNFIYFRIAPDFGRAMEGNCNLFLLNSIPVLTARKEPLRVAFNATLKRAFDIGFSLLVICVLFPFVMPLIALSIRLDSDGPIIFKQLRPGKRNKLFDCYKFRTMRVNQSTEVQATKNDSRVTRVGRFLRKTNLDELPQFFNVLLGNMSVVGPRPNMASQLEQYSKTIQQYKLRHFITPGITGYAQVNGYRGETKDHKLMEQRVKYDVLYLENWSLSLDIKIIFLTVWNMLKGDRNAY
ncbi:MAG: undecaprenyl-phosphate glucose phosphotransferase [Cyclobacteriaceae bacterium]